MIHQPRAEIFDDVDTLLALARGRVIKYIGRLQRRAAALPKAKLQHAANVGDLVLDNIDVLPRRDGDPTQHGLATPA